MGGSSSSPVTNGSDEDIDISCDPCTENGKHVEASGYCKNCNEYLCQACVKVHRLPKPCRHHVVLDKHEMPKNKAVTSEPKVTLCTITCDKHPNEYLKFFCKTHEVTGCGDCMILDHKTCLVDYISTLAEGYNENVEYTSIIQKVDQLRTEVNDKLTVADKSATKAQETVNKALADMKQHRTNVIAHFNDIERKLEIKCENIKSVNQRATTKTKDELKSSIKQVTSLHASLTSNMENTANLFVWTKETGSKLVALENEIRAIKKAQLKCVKFVKSVSVISEMSSATLFGELNVSKI